MYDDGAPGEAVHVNHDEEGKAFLFLLLLLLLSKERGREELVCFFVIKRIT